MLVTQSGTRSKHGSRDSAKAKQHRSSLDVISATHCSDLLADHQCVRSKSLYSCVADAVDAIQHQGHRDVRRTAGGSHYSSWRFLPCSATNVILRRCDLVQRGSLLSAGALLSAASRRASCPETSRLAMLDVRHQHYLRRVPSGSMAVSEEDESNEDNIGIGKQQSK